jgi:hypothetical protein
MYEGLEDTPLVPESPKPQNPRIRDSEIPGFAGSLILRDGACACAACWFESLPNLYFYMAILEVIS